MAVKVRTKTNKIPLMEKEFNSLNGKKVQVGVLGGGENAWLAGIHEYGCTIEPVNKQYLAVPCNPKAFGKETKDFTDLFLITSKKGNKLLVRKKGKNGIEPMFWLTKSVHIPERSFLRAGYDQNINSVLKNIGRTVNMVGNGKSVDVFCEKVGELLADRIKDYAEHLKTPPKSSVTLAANPSKIQPLWQTGNMISSITYRVE